MLNKTAHVDEGLRVCFLLHLMNVNNIIPSIQSLDLRLHDPSLQMLLLHRFVFAVY